jgi:hypothetical protein
MKLFGRKSSPESENLTEQEKNLHSAINTVRLTQNIQDITNDYEAELVLVELLKNSGFELNAHTLRDYDFTIEENREHILLKVNEVHELVGSSLSSRPIKAALSSFVFQAGVAFGAEVDVVKSAFEELVSSDNSDTFLILAESDSYFNVQLTNYVLSLKKNEAKSFLSTLKKVTSKSIPQFGTVIEKIEATSDAHHAKVAKEASKTVTNSSKSRSAVSSSNAPKYCANCGEPLAGEAKFCGSCGSPTART